MVICYHQQHTLSADAEDRVLTQCQQKMIPIIKTTMAGRADGYLSRVLHGRTHVGSRGGSIEDTKLLVITGLQCY